jgi:hypothetical protein
MSRRRYAAARGVSEAAIRKAVRAGRIEPTADGLIDPDQADANWYRYSQANPETHAVVDPAVLDDDYIRRVLAEEPPPYDDTGIQRLLAGLPEDRVAEQIEALRREVAELRKELRDRPHLPGLAAELQHGLADLKLSMGVLLHQVSLKLDGKPLTVAADAFTDPRLRVRR